MSDDRIPGVRPLRRLLPVAGSCVFLDGPNECRIQPVKPGQCVGFPNTWNFPGFEKKCRSHVNQE